MAHVTEKARWSCVRLARGVVCMVGVERGCEMTRNNLPSELSDIFFGARDETPSEETGSDFYEKFLADANLAGTLNESPAAARQRVANFSAEAAQRNVGLDAHYRKLADAAKKNP